MKPLARKSDPPEEQPDEIAGLERALDKSYARMRERARAAWERHHAGNDPADACVTVRVASAAEATPKKRPRLRISKARPARKKVARRPRQIKR